MDWFPLSGRQILIPPILWSEAPYGSLWIPMESKDVLQILVRSQSIQVLYISVAIAGRSSQSAAAQEEGNG
jgi:hypothetical protein